MQSVDGQLSALRQSWSTKAYIHFDLRDDVLLGRHTRSVTLIDWETAGFGDPCYDVGTVIGQMLAHRIPTLRAGTDPQGLDRALVAAGTFLDAYRRRSGADGATMVRSVQFAGVFLLLSCLGRLEKVGSLGQVGHLCLLVGRHLVLHPDAGRAAICSGNPT